ncbi:MAG: cupin [Dehalococcoidia bacterium]
MSQEPQYIEPVEDGRAGWHDDKNGQAKSYYRRLPSAWETFLKEEGLPIFRGVGVRDTRDLPRVDWARVGAKGTYIQVTGTENATGMFVIEVPPRSETKAQRHLYEERYVVMEGRGSVEVWKNRDTVRTAFEFGPWSLFSIPLNANFRIVNSGSTPVLAIAVNTAPRSINHFGSNAFIFENDFDFEDRWRGNLEDYWNANEELVPQPVRGRGMVKSNFLPDVANSYLPLDNNRGPGYRWVAPDQVGNRMVQGWIAEYPGGRYGKAHYHASGAVLVCLNGQGYSITWPRDEGGITPWKDGKGHLVKIQEYVPGGLISAAPGPSNWYHQHFAACATPFRVFNYTGTMPGNPESGRNRVYDQAEEGALVKQHAEITDGGNAIPYHMEDPYIRQMFEEKLKEVGASFAMPEIVYTAAGKNMNVMSD